MVTYVHTWGTKMFQLHGSFHRSNECLTVAYVCNCSLDAVFFGQGLRIWPMVALHTEDTLISFWSISKFFHGLNPFSTNQNLVTLKYIFLLQGAVSSAPFTSRKTPQFTLPMTTFIFFSELSKLLHHILPFTAGGFLNIALVSVVPPLMQVTYRIIYFTLRHRNIFARCFYSLLYCRILLSNLPFDSYSHSFLSMFFL